ncbi:MAG: hypothetical protein HUK05_05520, partial [Prevotella sp.]|nr:hypothetical protein [Prevotella sp.]
NGYKGQKVIEKNFDIKNYYTPEKSNITLPALKGGVYLMQLESCDERDSRSYKDPNGFELNTNQSKAFDQDLLYVSNLKILRLALGNKKYRQVVVDSETGHEVKEAVIVKDKDNSMAAYTADDNGMPYGYMRGGSFYLNKPERENNEINLFLDRGVYRPGQTVHVAAIAHTVKDGLQTEVAANQKITLSLVDANWQNVEERDFTTDEYGTVSAEFTIPTDRLTGRWTIRVRGFGSSDVRFRVEEYKRPSFEVTFKKYEQDYKLGDTIKVVGVAKTYAGVPVANAKVICEVKRERPMWCWWHCSSYGIQLAKDTVQTDDNGEFIMDVPLSYPIDKNVDGNDIVCYYYKVTADVTSMAGETQQGETGLVASNKPLMLKVAIKNKILKTEDTRLEVTVRNNAGEVQKDAVTTLKIAGIDKKFATVDEANAAIKQLASGKYKLIAEARKNDAVATDTAEFVVFTLDDKKPVIDTLQWSYITHSQFKDKDDVITVQFGSSAEDVEVFYDVFVGEEHTESSVLHVSNSLIRKDFKAVEGENILVTYAWVKKGVLYQQQHCLWKAVPKKTLNLTWKTFRNKLLPGQKEEWTLTVDNPNDKKKTGVQMLACMFDKSLEAIAPNYWQMRLGMNTGTSYSEWTANSHGNASLHLYRIFKSVKEEHPVFSKFNIWPFKWWYRTFADEDYDVVEAEVNNEVAVVSSYKSVAKSRAAAPMAMSKLEGRISGISGVNSEAAEEKVYDVVEESARFAPNSDNGSEAEGIEMRSNFAETAFFYPQLMTDDKGNVAIKFTLPESTTTWKFRALAHDKAMNNGMLEDEIIAQKQLMISPNMPRFIRKGDKNVLASIVSNMSDKVLETKTTIEILDPETERVLYSQSVNNTIEGGKTAAVNFDITPEDIAKGNSADAEAIGSLYIIKVFTQAGGMSDGEQRYLAIIDNVEPVMTTKAITMIKPGKETINTAELFPTDATERKLTVEWTENPAWLMLETLPYMQNQDQTTSYSQAAAFYANALGSSILKAMPENVKRQIQQPINVEENKSALEKNSELKTLLLNETPWVVDAKNETERIQMLKNFYDENKLAYNQQQIIKKLKDEQNSDGGWSWCSGMQTSYWITSEICELFVRLNNMIGKQEATSTLLKNAMKCLQKKAHEEVEQWRKSEKKGNDVYIYD